MRNLFTAMLCLVTILSFGLPSSARAQTGQTPVFYVGAHPDDIQLFIGNQAAADASSTSVRSVWIVVTAGNGDGDSNIWKAREAGALASMEAALAWYQGSFPTGCYHTRDVPTMNGHSMVRYKLFDSVGRERSVMYCMRLPDGDQTGSGFASTSYESLYKLVNGTISSIHTVDGSATYSSARDVMLTLDNIMTSEKNATSPSSHPWLNANEYSGMRNTNDGTDDHTDHRVVGSMLASFAKGNGYNRLWWISYTVYSGGGYTSLTGTDLSNKDALFHAYTHAMDTLLTFFDGETPPTGEDWSFSGSSHELDIHDGWWNEWNAYGPYMRVITRTYSTDDTGNHYPLTYP